MITIQRQAIQVENLDGGPNFFLPVTVDPTTGAVTLSGILVSGLSLTTAGVTDSTDKRFLTDALLAALTTMAARRMPEQILATVDSDILNRIARFHCERGRSCSHSRATTLL